MEAISARNNFLIITAIILLGGLMFIPFLGNVHLFDWDEVNFAESSREMLLTGEYLKVQINYEPFWEKPPLFNWLQVISMRIFGVNEFAARFPNAVCGIITLVVLYLVGKREFNFRFGLFWCLVYAGSFLPHLYFKSGIIDPVFNLFIFLGIYHWSLVTSVPRDYKTSRNLNVVIAGIFIGMAILTKGPVAFLIAILSILVYWTVKRSRRIIKIKEILIFSGVAFLVSCLWFGTETINNGPWFLEEFIRYQIRLFQTQDAGHGGPFFYHFVVLLLGCFPASIYIFKSFQKVYSDNYRQKNMKAWMIVSLMVVLILFSIVKTKIVHYSSFCYFPISFLAAYVLYKVWMRKLFFTGFFNWMFGILGILIGLVFILFPLFFLLKDQFNLVSYLKDPFAMAAFSAQVEWSWIHLIPGIVYLILIPVVIFINNRNSIIAAIILFSSTILLTQITLLTVVPKIDAYIQKAPMDFYKEKSSEDAYISVFGFKSYAQYFYGQRPPGLRPESNDINFLLHGDIDKPLYLVSKAGRHADLDKLPELKKLKTENGFVFYRRDPKP